MTGPGPVMTKSRKPTRFYLILAPMGSSPGMTLLAGRRQRPSPRHRPDNGRMSAVSALEPQNSARGRRLPRRACRLVGLGAGDRAGGLVRGVLHGGVVGFGHVLLEGLDTF